MPPLSELSVIEDGLVGEAKRIHDPVKIYAFLIFGNSILRHVLVLHRVCACVWQCQVCVQIKN